MGIILWVWDRNKRDFKSDYDIWRKQDNTCYTIYNVMYPTVNFVSYNGMLIFKKNTQYSRILCKNLMSRNQKENPGKGYLNLGSSAKYD